MWTGSQEAVSTTAVWLFATVLPGSLTEMTGIQAPDNEVTMPLVIVSSCRFEFRFSSFVLDARGLVHGDDLIDEHVVEDRNAARDDPPRNGAAPITSLPTAMGLFTSLR